MSLDENNQVILLLSAHFSPARRGDPTPLTPIEYGRISHWLHENQYQPKDLFSRFEEVGQAWVDPKGKITLERLEYLLGRGAAMGIALEKWSSAGIWIVTRANSEYPERLKRILGKAAPASLFGVGNKRLLNAGGLAIVGSRDIDSSDRAYAQRIAQRASNEGINIVSGGAKGVDETAMLAALEVEGNALGILANDLMKSALSGKWRPHIKKNQLCLVSTYYPEASFHVGNAMGRNKYIYCLADYGLVVRSDKGKGGTWAGATEALKKGLAPVFVKPDSDAEGNAALMGLGAAPLSAPAGDGPETEGWLEQALKARLDSDAIDSPGLGGSSTSPASVQPGVRALGFEVFVEDLDQILNTKLEVTLKELKERYSDLKEKQITDWLRRAVTEGLIERPGELHKYRLKAGREAQQSLFDAEG